MGKARQPNHVIITGSTGMVGEGVLIQCLNSNEIDSVLVINRKTCGYTHAKLREIIHQNFFDFSVIESQLTGYNACFFCLGVTSVGASEEVYYKMTYTLTLHVAETLSRLNTDMTFCYVSGNGTNENGKLNWQRVKGKTENDLTNLPFEQVYNFRPGFIKPSASQQFAHKFYKYINWIFPLGRKFFPNGFCTMEELGNAMIYTLSRHQERKIVEGKEIIEMGREG